MSNHRILLVAAALSFTIPLAHTLHADEEKPIVSVGKEVVFSASPECGNVQASVPTVGPNRASLVLAFDDFSVEASQQAAPKPRVCNLHATIAVPDGMMLRPVAAFADGEAFTSENGGGSVAIKYAWGTDSPVTKEARKDFPASTTEAFLLETEEHGSDAWSRCPGDPGNGRTGQVALEGSLEVSAFRGKWDKRTSDVSIFNSEAQAQAVRWIWEWGSCGYQNKTWRSQYTTPGGQWVSGKTTLVGNRGRYEANAGGRGTFTKVDYQDRGNVALGLWRFENGATGWFSFRLEGNGKSFDGTWGEGNVVGVNAKGRWRGER